MIPPRCAICCHWRPMALLVLFGANKTPVKLDAHFGAILTKASARKGVLNRAAGSPWCLDVGILEMRRDALLATLFRYAPDLTAPCFPPGLLKPTNAHIVIIASRRVGGLIGTARAEGPCFLWGSSTTDNLFLLHCAEFLYLCLRVSQSSTNTRLKEELWDYYNTTTFATQDCKIIHPIRDSHAPSEEGGGARRGFADLFASHHLDRTARK